MGVSSVFCASFWSHSQFKNKNKMKDFQSLEVRIIIRRVRTMLIFCNCYKYDPRGPAG